MSQPYNYCFVVDSVLTSYELWPISKQNDRYIYLISQSSSLVIGRAHTNNNAEEWIVLWCTKKKNKKNDNIEMPIHHKHTVHISTYITHIQRSSIYVNMQPMHFSAYEFSFTTHETYYIVCWSGGPLKYTECPLSTWDQAMKCQGYTHSEAYVILDLLKKKNMFQHVWDCVRSVYINFKATFNLACNCFSFTRN